MDTYNYIIYAVWIASCVVIYYDAKRRNLKAALSWAIIGLLLGIIGLIGYLFMIVVPNKRDI